MLMKSMASLKVSATGRGGRGRGGRGGVPPMRKMRSGNCVPMKSYGIKTRHHQQPPPPSQQQQTSYTYMTSNNSTITSEAPRAVVGDINDIDGDDV